MASVFKASVNQAVNDQPWYLRFKGSILILGSGAAWVLGQLAQSQEIADLGWEVGVGIAASLVAFLVNRFTKDGITPSAAERLEKAGSEAFLDRAGQSGVTVDADGTTHQE